MNLPNQLRYKDESLIIGKGTIISYNACIPLHAVSCIKIEGKKRKPLGKILVALIIGVVMLIIPVLRIFGGIVFSCAFLELVCTVIANYFGKCSLVIQTNSGTMLILEHPKIDFIKNVAEAIRKGLDDTAGVYYIHMKETKIVQKIKGNPSFYNFGKDNQFVDSPITINGGHHSYEENVVDSYNSSLFTDEEWEKLEHYFKLRAGELGEKAAAYNACKQMQQLSKEKNAKGLRKVMGAVGKEIVMAVIGSATEYGIAELLRRLAST